MENDEVIDHQDVEQEQVDVSQEVDNLIDDMQQDVAEDQSGESEQQSKQVPLEALQKERRKRQEAEMNAAYQYQQLQQLQQQYQAPVEEDDDRKYQAATQEELDQKQRQTLQLIEEKIWTAANPEKRKRVDEELKTFLEQRPHLRVAINSCENRYKEAFELMDALTPKQQQQLRQQPVKREAPNSPASVPKAVAMNAAVNVMSMSDKEFSEWRNSQRSRR